MVRFKNRYIAIEITPQDKSDRPLSLKVTTLHNAVSEKVHQLYGDFGVAAMKAGFTAKYCNVHTRIALIKLRHGPHRFVVESVPKITDLAGRFVAIKILYIGATMKHCFDFVRKHQQRKLERVWSTLKTDAERKQMENALLTMTNAMKEFQ